MKNQDKVTVNYAKWFTKKKGKSSIAHIKDSDNSGNSLYFRCKFCKKKHGLSKCWHLQAKCHYYHDVGHITKFYRKKSFPRTSPPKEIITCT